VSSTGVSFPSRASREKFSCDDGHPLTWCSCYVPRDIDRVRP